MVHWPQTMVNFSFLFFLRYYGAGLGLELFICSMDYSQRIMGGRIQAIFSVLQMLVQELI